MVVLLSCSVNVQKTNFLLSVLASLSITRDFLTQLDVVIETSSTVHNRDDEDKKKMEGSESITRKKLATIRYTEQPGVSLNTTPTTLF